jgi:hypothetical protein
VRALRASGRRAAALSALALLTLAGPAAAKVSLQVSPPSVRAGDTVTVSGSVGSGCPQGDQVTLTSTAFGPGHEFAGVPAILGQAGPGGRFSVSTRIPSDRRPGTYSVGGRCGGGNFGSARFRVTGGGLPRTGVAAWEIGALGICLTAAGLGLRRRLV